MIIFTIQNVAWPNYYRSLVNIILDNKALYVYKHKNECDIKLKSTQLFLKKYLASSDRKQMHYT